MVRHLASVSALCLGLGLVAAPAAAQYSYSSVSTSTSSGLSPVYSVRNVQQALNTLGYNSGAPDGKVGPMTRAAIREFQGAQGLPITGQPSAALYDRLLAAAGGGSAPTYSQTQPAYGEPARELVTAVQSELRQRGYTVTSVDGNYDAQTRQAVMQYQGDAGMTITGEVSQSLLSHMRSASVERSMDRRQLVTSVQQELNRRGYDAGPADGALGPKTRSAISTYQSDARMPVTGDVSESLLASLRGSTVADRRDWQRDRQDADDGLVRDIQAELRDRGLYDGPVNGDLNRRTRSAIGAYQSAMRMPQTGQPSVDLLASLRISDRASGDYRRDGMVEDIERRLASRGYDVGRIDGRIDSETRAAIRDYQRDAGLRIDGEATASLLDHIGRHNVRADAWGSGRNYSYDPRPYMDRFFQNLGENR